MITAILLLALMQPQDPAPAATNTPDRTEKLTATEVKQLADAVQTLVVQKGG